MKKLIATFFLLALTVILVSCRWTPPSTEDMDSFVSEHWKEITLINDYLMEFGDRDAYISDDDGSILIALDNQTVEAEAVREAVQALWRSGCKGISKINHNNAIEYTMWTRTYGQISCGFVYSIDHAFPPKVQFQTELAPLSEDGWFYYVADYEKWRLS